jgi:methyl-accepting chemotaxis protein
VSAPQPPKKKPGTFRRRIILIKRGLQMKYVILVFVTVLLTVSIVSLDVYYVVGKLLISHFGEENIVPIVHSASRLLWTHLSLYLLIVLLASVFVSHKFAGPIFRLERVSEAIAQGDLTVKVVFRDGDELFETAEYFNRMIEFLREKIQKDQNLSSRITANLNDLSVKLASGAISPKEASALLNDIIMEVRHIASDFKL